ncbi:MAG: hypothetical protein BZ138_06195 [Methanosphaera sp. rholeuAM270]|nr:MAG: hypothetical protein BZ138_06195 [Methanosphaera sp. rholeuAM270]
METSVGLQPFMSFSPWMLAVGVAMLVVAAIVVALLVSSRIRGKEKRTDRAPLTARERRDARSACLASLDALADSLSRGEIDARAAATSASFAVRTFAQEMTRSAYPSMTLEEIERASGAPGLADAVARCYSNEFPEDPSSDARSAISACREVVRRWS